MIYCSSFKEPYTISWSGDTSFHIIKQCKIRCICTITLTQSHNLCCGYDMQFIIAHLNFLRVQIVHENALSVPTCMSPGAGVRIVHMVAMTVSMVMSMVMMVVMVSGVERYHKHIRFKHTNQFNISHSFERAYTCHVLISERQRLSSPVSGLVPVTHRTVCYRHTWFDCVWVFAFALGWVNHWMGLFTIAFRVLGTRASSLYVHRSIWWHTEKTLR